jgi:hypothetical protein
MAKTNPTASPEILEAALHGLELQREKLEEQIAQVRSMLGRRVGRPPRAAKSESAQEAKSGRGRRKLSDEARKRIAAAQKKRWAAFRKAGGKKA